MDQRRLEPPTFCTKSQSSYNADQVHLTGFEPPTQLVERVAAPVRVPAARRGDRGSAPYLSISADDAFQVALLDMPGSQHKRKQNEMFEASPNESPDRVESQSTPCVPLLIEVLDRVERELIREGVDLSRLAEGDLSAFETPTSTPGSDTAPRT